MSILEAASYSETSLRFCSAVSAGPETASVAAADRVEPARPTGTGKVLVIDDSRVARRYLETVLLKSGVCRLVLLAESGREGMSLLREHDVDLVLSDVNMPGLSGFDFLTRMRADRAFAEIPVIMLTGEQSFQSKLRCLESGASDYLLKPFADEELVARARIHLQLKGLQDELRSKNEQLSELAHLDSLTGIPNRHSFFESLERELGRAQRQRQPLTLGMIDIDHFKRVNDERGHLCGDQALVRTAELLKSGLRNYDLLGRYGGEEFATLFVDAGAEVAMIIAERCRRRVAESPFVLDGRKLNITVSIGLALALEPEPGMLTELISRADEALYMAKHRGRNQVVLAPQEIACVGGGRESGDRSL
ncbi:MAG: diguanylate cyclase [bacterium]|nr:diguanylate cyclase [bacterium]